MKPVEGKILFVPELESTQDELASWVREGNRSIVGVRADFQSKGRGRLGRGWLTPPGEALALSLALYPYADWEQPQLLGMAVALAVAEALDLSLRWPNDLVLCLDEGVRKVGGILSEMIPAGKSRIPVIGIGVNLAVAEFPSELKATATSLLLAGRKPPTPEEAQERILDAIREVPEPTAWSALAGRWMARDVTPGKPYLLDGRPGEAVGINDEGHLIVRTEEGLTIVPSAEAWYGGSTP
ncbi:MAG: biotin--[acetyl-CoA-carboxylase] ligase [Fimbriimonadales bacterium]|nr:MAG: biotin--[acetyl-CoA-carboxylase] ligase [Fimbriimonadales bacterium]